MEPIKPCPFCGGEGSLSYNSKTYNHYERYFVRIECEMCGSQGKTIVSSENPEENCWETNDCHIAIRAWNRRVVEIKVT